MADNITVSPGAGATIGADDVGGVLIQRIKNTWGADGTATDVDVAAGMPVQSGWKELTGSAAANNTDLVSADVSGYRWVSVQLTGTFNANIAFQQSNDGLTWQPLYIIQTSALFNGYSSAANTSGVTCAGPITSRYIRFRTNAYTSGPVGIVVELSAVPSAHFMTPVFVGTGTLPVSATGGTSSTADAQAGATSFSAAGMGYNGTTWDRLRTPTTFKSAAATASGSTVVWTPTSGKKFRLMRYKIDVSQDAAQTTGGVITIALLDNATDMGLSQSAFVPATAATTMGPGWTSGWIDLGNGRISSTINLSMNVNLSAALTSGTVRVVAAGVEE
jgi:hypothetical protein